MSRKDGIITFDRLTNLNKRQAEIREEEKQKEFRQSVINMIRKYESFCDNGSITTDDDIVDFIKYYLSVKRKVNNHNG